MPTLQTIRAKLAQLRAVDAQLELFGASTHRYALAPTLTAAEVEAFDMLLP
jgi:hypothetical protein